MHNYFVAFLALVGIAVLLFGAVALGLWISEEYGHRINRWMSKTFPDWMKRMGTIFVGLGFVLFILLIVLAVYIGVYDWVWGTPVLGLGG